MRFQCNISKMFLHPWGVLVFLIFTGRKRSLRRLCFTPTCLSVFLFTAGCLPQYMLGYTPPSRHPPGADTSPRSRQGQQAGGTHLICILVLQNFSERQILWSLCSVLFYALTLRLPIQTSLPKLPFFCTFKMKIVKISAKREHPRCHRK